MPALISTGTPNKISLFRGDTHTVEVTAKKKNPANPTGPLIPVDVTGSTSLLTVKTRADDNTILIQKAGTIVNPPGTDGKLRFDFIPFDTASLKPGPYVYDVEVTVPVGKVYTVLKDTFEVKEDVTNTGTPPPPPPTPPPPTPVATGWISITDIAVTGGAAANKVWDDPPNNTILQSCSVSGLSLLVSVKASAPRVTVGGVSAILPPHVSGGYYLGTVAVPILASGDIVAQVTTPDGAAGAVDTATVTYVPAPTILTLAFTGGYPGAQTELKAGDTFQLTGTTDVPAVALDIQDFGACIAQTPVISGTSFTVTVTIANRGVTPQALAARARAQDANLAYGPLFDSTNTVVLNNLYPTVTFGAKTYPIGQQALKNAETADVAVTLANLDSVVFTSPNGDLSVLNPTTIEATKTVTRIAGTYNVATNNLQGQATRNANGAVTTTQTVVNIANVAPTVNVTVPAARLRSGGNDGTAVQGHTVTITADQQLLNAPSLAEGVGGGTFIGGGFVGGPSVWTRTLNVHDNDTKGSYSFTTLVATGLSGIVQNTINSGSAYVLGGFVQRTLTFAAFSQSSTLNVGVVTYAKLQGTLFTATNNVPIRNPIQGDTSNLVDTFTVLTLGNVGPITLFWNDQAGAATNSSGTAQIQGVEELV